MSEAAADKSTNETARDKNVYKPVPDDVIPAGQLPPLCYRDLPEPISLRKMIGPSIILAGLALGSGEFIIWPYITYRSGFIFFWACVLGVTTQYFLNMEISRWTLATGESAITGFVRRSKHWAWAFLLMNIIPWMFPGWARGAAQLVSWLIWGPDLNAQGEIIGTPYATELAIAGMVFCGVVLTAGPVVYNTLEKVQIFLVSVIVAVVLCLAIWLLTLRPDAIGAQLSSTMSLGLPESYQWLRGELVLMGISPIVMLGALAFAGAGGTTNLGQSNYIKDKGYGMGSYIGRITSPITGQEEAITEVGYHFPGTSANLGRWRRWWRSASIEHFLSFFLTCLLCLVLLTLISYITFYDEAGNPLDKAGRYSNDLNFVWGEAEGLARLIGGPARLMFLGMGVAILLTTEFGVLDVVSRISTDIVKVAWLRENTWWSESRLYYVFLWGTILLGSGILLLSKFGIDTSAFILFKTSSALNGAVMFLYSGLLLYLNRFMLPAAIRMSWWRAIIIAWAVAFFGFFAVWAGWSTMKPLLGL